jgi:uncharacterized protein (UPF0548 family)
MFLISRPSKPAINSFIDRARGSELTYRNFGATDDVPPAGYVVDHNRIEIGSDWESAKQAVREWKMFDLDWVGIRWPDVPIEAEQVVAILIRHFGVYSLNAARIVYTIDEADRFGFAYGTLGEHGESGEERFMVERDADGNVWYDLKAFSKPNHALAKIGYPFVRMLQKRFVHDSKQAMLRAVRDNRIN